MKQWAPRCHTDELSELIDRVDANPRTWSADDLAHELGLHILPFAVRQALGLTTIGSIDVDKAAREQRRAAKKKENSAAWRRRNGVISRSDYLAANVASQTKPWVALGERRVRSALQRQPGIHGVRETSCADGGKAHNWRAFAI